MPQALWPNKLTWTDNTLQTASRHEGATYMQYDVHLGSNLYSQRFLSWYPPQHTQLHTRRKRKNKHTMILMFTNAVKVYPKLPKCYSYIIWTNFLCCSYGWISVHVNFYSQSASRYFTCHVVAEQAWIEVCRYGHMIKVPDHVGFVLQQSTDKISELYTDNRGSCLRVCPKP